MDMVFKVGIQETEKYKDIRISAKTRFLTSRILQIDVDIIIFLKSYLFWKKRHKRIFSKKK